MASPSPLSRLNVFFREEKSFFSLMSGSLPPPPLLMARSLKKKIFLRLPLINFWISSSLFYQWWQVTINKMPDNTAMFNWWPCTRCRNDKSRLGLHPRSPHGDHRSALIQTPRPNFGHLLFKLKSKFLRRKNNFTKIVNELLVLKLFPLSNSDQLFS